jgi:hypothetical protein
MTELHGSMLDHRRTNVDNSVADILIFHCASHSQIVETLTTKAKMVRGNVQVRKLHYIVETNRSSNDTA